LKRFAFLAGHNGPPDAHLDNLRYVYNDVSRLEQVLARPPASFDQVLVAQTGLSAAELLQQFEALSNDCGYEDMLLLYFSGHGFYQRGQLYLVAESTVLARPVTTALPISSIKSVFANTKARVRLLILDCCHSGAAGEAQFTRGSHAEFSGPIFEAARDSASLILTACGRNAVTREIPEFESGYLTHLLVRALSDQFQNADFDGDGLLSITDFMEWCSRQTAAFNQGRSRLEAIAPPELYGDFRSAVYLTAQRITYSNAFTDSLNEKAVKAVEAVRRAYEETRYLNYKQLENLARPLRRIAPTFTDLRILDELFEKGDSAAIFSAAVILQVRRDPNYMQKLVTWIDDGSLRGSANWRVLRAVRDTLPSYDLSATGRADLIARLQQATVQRETKTGPMFARGTTMDMIRQVCTKLRIPFDQVFTAAQLEHLPGRSPRGRVAGP
jgi:hypothetical protein